LGFEAREKYVLMSFELCGSGNCVGAGRTRPRNARLHRGSAGRRQNRRGRCSVVRELPTSGRLTGYLDDYCHRMADVTARVDIMPYGLAPWPEAPGGRP
jgi:hypothetical protein